MSGRVLLPLCVLLLVASLPAAPAAPSGEAGPCGRPVGHAAHVVLCDWDEDGVPDSWYATSVAGPHRWNATSEGNRSSGQTWTFNRVEWPGQAQVYADAYRWSNGTHNHTWAAFGASTHRWGPLGLQAAQGTLACRGEGRLDECDEAWMDGRVVSAGAGRGQSVTVVRDATGTWACAFGAATLGCARLLP